VIVGFALVMNVITNYALFKRFNSIWDNKANVALFAAFTFPSASTASLVTWYSKAHMTEEGSQRQIFQYVGIMFASMTVIFQVMFMFFMLVKLPDWFSLPKSKKVE